jgi:hypothetical protein
LGEEPDVIPIYLKKITKMLGSLKILPYICKTKWESGWSHHLIKPNEWISFQHISGGVKKPGITLTFCKKKIKKDLEVWKTFCIFDLSLKLIGDERYSDFKQKKIKKD